MTFLRLRCTLKNMSANTNMAKTTTATISPISKPVIASAKRLKLNYGKEIYHL